MNVSYLNIQMDQKGTVKVPFYWGSHSNARFMQNSGRSLESVLYQGFNMSDVLSIIEIGIEEGQIAIGQGEDIIVMDARIAGRMVDTNKHLVSDVMKIVKDSTQVIFENLEVDPSLVEDADEGSKKKKGKKRRGS